MSVAHFRKISRGSNGILLTAQTFLQMSLAKPFVYGQNDLKLAKAIFNLDLVRKAEFSMQNQNCHQVTVN